jgi:hypothetical protein
MVQLTPPGWSADANWFWDGREWQDAISPDGKWRFDGKDWKRFRGNRSPMPTAPLYEPAPMQATPVAPIEMPSWVAPSEVERIVKEKHEAAAYAAVPKIPPPPELDWRKAGHYIEHSQTIKIYQYWQTGGASIAYFIILEFTCALAALIFIWRTAWRLPMKVIMTVVAIFLPGAVYFLLIALGANSIDLRR